MPADPEARLTEAIALLKEALPYLTENGYGFHEDAVALGMAIKKFTGDYVSPGAQRAKEVSAAFGTAMGLATPAEKEKPLADRKPTPQPKKSTKKK